MKRCESGSKLVLSQGGDLPGWHWQQETLPSHSAGLHIHLEAEAPGWKTDTKQQQNWNANLMRTETTINWIVCTWFQTSTVSNAEVLYFFDPQLMNIIVLWFFFVHNKSEEIKSRKKSLHERLGNSQGLPSMLRNAERWGHFEFA